MTEALSSSMASQYDPRFGFDPVAAFLRRPLHEVVGEQTKAQKASPPRVPRTVAGLRELCAQYAWLAVLELATSLLAEHDEEAAPELHPFLPHERLLVAAYRALALLQTRQVASAENAIRQLGELDGSDEQYRYESYPRVYTNGEKGSFVPFELRTLALEIRMRQGDSTTIADCYTLKRRVVSDEGLSDEDRKIRLGMLLSMLASFHLVALQHDAAVDVARELCDVMGGTALARYLYARVLLRVGDFDVAGEMVRLAKGRDGDCASMRHLHLGMVHAGRGRFQEALGEYDAALAKESEGEKGCPKNLWVFAGNNAAVCLVQLGRLAEAIDRLEGTLRRGPEVAIDEGVAFNLGVMYDLAYPQNSVERKRVLRKLAERFGREGFDVQRIGMDTRGKSG